MSFNVALSGINAASADLDVTSNNISNVNTIGFKGSNAQFADVFAASSGQNAIGSGVRLASVAQQFAQGNLDYTNNSLDLAISGKGFFTLRNNSGLAYSRAGAFSVDRNGSVVNSQGDHLQVYPTTAAGGFDISALQNLTLSTTQSSPKATTTASLNLNLSATATPPVAAFNKADPSTYNSTTSFTGYDSLGAAHTANVYFVKKANPANTWDTLTYIDGAAVGGAQQLTYNAQGALITPNTGQLTLPAVTLANGAAPLNIKLDLSGSSQFGDTFSVASITQDGNITGRLTGIDISNKGVVSARFSNGQSTSLGQVALTSFANPNGLQQLGNTTWGESFQSGQALHGTAGEGDVGLVQSGALEASNVDLTGQLVNMIKAQRNFQANAQVITASSKVTQAVLDSIR